MENIYCPTKYDATENISLKEYFKKYEVQLSNLKKSYVKTSDQNENIFSITGVNFDKKQKDCLTNYCSYTNLDVPGESEPIGVRDKTFQKLLCLYKPYQITENAKKLKSVQCLIERENDKDAQMKFRKHLHNMCLDLELPSPIPKENDNDLEIGKDFLVYIRIFKPFKYKYGIRVCRPLKFCQEVALLGSNTLAEFRDKINCPSDLAICKEISENPLLNITPHSDTSLYPSGFIFIDGVFYDDFRNSEAISYSEVIRKWASSKGIGDFTTSEMDKARIDSLCPRIGYPYIYMHKGCCEHLLMVSHCRLLTFGDSLCSSDYPFYSCVGKMSDKLCIFCGISTAYWLIVDSDRIPHNYAPVCSDCFKSYNYIGDQKVGDFKAYPFFNKGTVV